MATISSSATLATLFNTDDKITTASPSQSSSSEKLPKRDVRRGRAPSLDDLVVCWWNGGGAVRRRLKTNIFLQDFLKTLPDIFSYGEAQATSTRGLFLEGYSVVLHPSSNHSKNSYSRRGIAVFFLKKYSQKIYNVLSSTKFDNIWLKMESKSTPTYFCFF